MVFSEVTRVTTEPKYVPQKVNRYMLPKNREATSLTASVTMTPLNIWKS